MEQHFVRSVTLSALGTQTFIAAASGRKIRVKSLYVQNQSSTAVTVKFFDTTSSPVAQIGNSIEVLGQNQGDGLSIERPELARFVFEGPDGSGIQVNLSAAVAVHVHAEYVLRPV